MRWNPCVPKMKETVLIWINSLPGYRRHTTLIDRGELDGILEGARERAGIESRHLAYRYLALRFLAYNIGYGKSVHIRRDRQATSFRRRLEGAAESDLLSC